MNDVMCHTDLLLRAQTYRSIHRCDTLIVAVIIIIKTNDKVFPVFIVDIEQESGALGYSA